MEMELTELRKELLRQHAELRELAKVVARVSERARGDVRRLPELRLLLQSLYDELRVHNEYEEEQLSAILPKIDAWGPVRDDLMGLHHGEEHAWILHGIEAAASEPRPAMIAESVADVLRELHAHMEREERELLSPDVLRDDLITSGVGG